MNMGSSIREHFLSLVEQLSPNIDMHSPLYNSLALSSLLLVASFVWVLTRLLLRLQFARFIAGSSPRWDVVLHDHGFFRRLARLAPALMIFIGTPVLIDQNVFLYETLRKLSMLFMLFTALSAMYALLNTVEDVYNSSVLATRAPITGFIQVLKLVMAILVLLLSISLLIERSPMLLLSGLTALAAVLLLIFRDTILGLVAGIQIAANRMFNTGDWIEMPKFNVDGEILEIGLTNVKVQNWDKTISTLPTYSLTNEAVKNWRGMSESGGRRIKRAIYIDVHSIKLCDKEMLARFAKIRFIEHYIAGKIDELQKYHQDNQIDQDDLLNSRRLTNIGTFRAYIQAYLAQHPKINKEMTTMVRQLSPTELGLPLEVYCFCADKQWVNYEQIQADLFDHLLAMAPLFDLTVYQRDGHLRIERN